MDGRDELGDISATPPVAAAFSSSLMTIRQDEPELESGESDGARARSRVFSRFGGDVEAGEASGQGARQREQSQGWRAWRECKGKKTRRDPRRRKDAKDNAWTQGRDGGLVDDGRWQWIFCLWGPSSAAPCCAFGAFWGLFQLSASGSSSTEAGLWAYEFSWRVGGARYSASTSRSSWQHRQVATNGYFNHTKYCGVRPGETSVTL